MILNALKQTFRNPMRSAFILTLIGVCVAGSFLFRSLHGGIFAQYREDTIRSKTGHGQVFSKGYWGKRFEVPSEKWIKQGHDYTAKLSALPGVAQVFPRVTFPAILSNGGIESGGLGTGIQSAAELTFFSGVNIIEGKALSNKPNTIVLGTGLAKKLAAKLGDSITILVTKISGSLNAQNFQVVGIFELGAKDLDEISFQIEIGEAQELLDTRSVETFAIALQSNEKWISFEDSITSQYPELEAISFETLDWVYYGNSVKWLDSQMSFFYLIIACVSFLSLFPSILASVLGRAQEVGFLRANGSTSSAVAGQVFLEKLILVCLGFVLGCAIFLVFSELIFVDGVTLPPPPGFTRPLHFFLRPPWNATHVVLLQNLGIVFVATIMALRIVLSKSIAQCLRSDSGF